MAAILVVDDEKGIREFLADALTGDSHSVAQAGDGLEALGAVQAQPFDLMITDLRMPGPVDGLGLLREARGAQPGMRVIVLTAHGTVPTAVEAIKLGAIDFLEKPVASPGELRTMVRRALGQRHRSGPGRRLPEPGAAGADPMRQLAEDVERALGPNYQVEEAIGRGGYAAVFRVHDHLLDRKLAAKALYPELAAVPAIAEQFRCEARTAARLQHSSIVPVLFVGTEDDVPCLVMPLVAGETLAARLRRDGPLPLGAALGIARDVASALDCAHGSGVVHRDVKPENILLEEITGRSLLTDFGIAKAVEHDSVGTGPGVMTGTPHYVSPEQAAGVRPLDARTDVYSFGIVTYEMLAGEPPFDGTNAQRIFAQHVSAPVPSLRRRRAELGAEIDRVLLRALAKDPADRFSGAGEFVRALEAASGGAGRGGSIFRRWRLRRDG